MGFDWNIVLNDMGIIICIVGSIWIINKKGLKLFKANAHLEKNSEMKMQEIESLAQHFLTTPAGAIVTQSLHLEVNRVTENYRKSEIWRLVLIGLCSFRESPSRLNFTQRYALISYVISSAPKEWGTDPQLISDILLEMDGLVKAFGSQDIVKAANAFTYEYNKTKKPESEMDFPENTTL